MQTEALHARVHALELCKVGLRVELQVVTAAQCIPCGDDVLHGLLHLINGIECFIVLDVALGFRPRLEFLVVFSTFELRLIFRCDFPSV